MYTGDRCTVIVSAWELTHPPPPPPLPYLANHSSAIFSFPPGTEKLNKFSPQADKDHIFFYEVFSDKEHSKPPGKYQWQELFKPTFFDPPLFENLRLKVVLPAERQADTLTVVSAFFSQRDIFVYLSYPFYLSICLVIYMHILIF